MTGSDDDDTLLSPTDMRYWFKVDSTIARVAAKLRIEEASALVSDYAAGKLTRQEANDRLDEHEAKWGIGAKTPDASLQQSVDEATNTLHGARLASKSARKRSR